MSGSDKRRIPLLLQPIYALWWLLSGVLILTGRLICALLGLVLMIVGVSVTMSIVGAPLGIPLAVLGLLFAIRAIF